MIITLLMVIFSTISIADNDHAGSIDMLTNEQKLLEIQKAIKDSNANWTAGFNSVFTPNEDHLQDLLGCLDESPEGNPDNNMSNQIYLPSSWDWRNVNGTNWITSIKNQGGCGSCVAFGTIGALEAVVQIEIGQTFDCDLSEAYLFFCGGGSCNSGWYTSDAVSFVRSKGVPDEECFPYKPVDLPCEDKASNWRDRLVKVTNTGSTGGEAGIKKALITYGPLVVDFDVYEDFGSYNGGIYEHVWGSLEAGHAVSIIGYNDDPGYWICKNSWGSGWGENGFFRIKYRQCRIDDNAYYFDGTHGNIQPTQPSNPHPRNGESDISSIANLSWTESIDFDGDDVSYNVYLSEGRKAKDLIAKNIQKPWFIVSGLKKNTIYSWKVIAEDEHGSQYSSDEWKFITRPPLPPVVNGTFNGKAKREYMFTAYATDKDGLNYYWFFDWGDNTTSGWLGPYGPNQKVIVSHTWEDKKKYTMKVRYKEDGVYSDWAYFELSMPKILQMHLLNNNQLAPFIREMLQRLLFLHL